MKKTFFETGLASSLAAALCILGFLAAPAQKASAQKVIDIAHPFVLVINRLKAKDKITEIYISDADNDNWGPNLCKKPLTHGMGQSFHMKRSLRMARIYDNRVRDDKGRYYSRYNVDIRSDSGIGKVLLRPQDLEKPMPKTSKPEAQTSAAKTNGGLPTPVLPGSSSADNAPADAGTSEAPSIPNYVLALPSSASTFKGSGDAARAAIVKAAQKYLHLPYVLGRPTPRPVAPDPMPKPSSMDCSGFVAQCYKDALGKTIPITALLMWEKGKRVKDGEEKPGDILCMDTMNKGQVTHVALVVDKNTLYQALSDGPADKVGVVQTKMTYPTHKKIYGFVTFVDTPAGNKSNYSPTSVTPLVYTIEAKLDHSDEKTKMALTGMVQFTFNSKVAGSHAYTYKFFPESKGDAAGDTETFRVEGGKSFTTQLCLPREAGLYKLQLINGKNVLIERTFDITK